MNKKLPLPLPGIFMFLIFRPFFLPAAVSALRAFTCRGLLPGIIYGVEEGLKGSIIFLAPRR
jgi:hypothetical protein